MRLSHLAGGLCGLGLGFALFLRTRHLQEQADRQGPTTPAPSEAPRAAWHRLLTSHSADPEAPPSLLPLVKPWRKGWSSRTLPPFSRCPSTRSQLESSTQPRFQESVAGASPRWLPPHPRSPRPSWAPSHVKQRGQERGAGERLEGTKGDSWTFQTQALCLP